MNKRSKKLDRKKKTRPSKGKKKTKPKNPTAYRIVRKAGYDEVAIEHSRQYKRIRLPGLSPAERGNFDYRLACCIRVGLVSARANIECNGVGISRRRETQGRNGGIVTSAPRQSRQILSRTSPILIIAHIHEQLRKSEVILAMRTGEVARALTSVVGADSVAIARETLNAG